MIIKEKLIELVKHYKTHRDLAIQLNCTEASIRRWLNNKVPSRISTSAIDDLYVKIIKKKEDENTMLRTIISGFLRFGQVKSNSNLFRDTREIYLALRTSLIRIEKCPINDIENLDRLFSITDEETVRQYYLQERYIEGN